MIKEKKIKRIYSDDILSLHANCIKTDDSTNIQIRDIKNNIKETKTHLKFLSEQAHIIEQDRKNKEKMIKEEAKKAQRFVKNEAKKAKEIIKEKEILLLLKVNKEHSIKCHLGRQNI